MLLFLAINVSLLFDYSPVQWKKTPINFIYYKFKINRNRTFAVYGRICKILVNFCICNKNARHDTTVHRHRG